MKKALLGILLFALCAVAFLTACTSFHLTPDASSASIGGQANDPAPISAAPKSAAVQSAEPVQTDDSFTATFEPLPSADPTQAPAQQSAAPLQSALPEATHSVQPSYELTKLATFSFADNDLVPVDLDYDGIIETVSLVSAPTDSLMKLIIESDSDFELDFDMSSLVCAYATDFCFGDGSAELVLSYIDSNDEYVTAVVGSFSPDTPISCATVEGWVEEVSDGGIMICRTADIIGMRGISMLYTFDTTTGEFTPDGREWTVYSYDQYAVLGAELRIEVEALEGSDGESAQDDGGDAAQNGQQSGEGSGESFILLPAGTELLPITTDCYSYIIIETADGIVGKISVSCDSGVYLLEGGIELNSLFEYLPQW